MTDDIGFLQITMFEGIDWNIVKLHSYKKNKMKKDLLHL